jgi:hypothetical protein
MREARNLKFQIWDFREGKGNGIGTWGNWGPSIFLGFNFFVARRSRQGRQRYGGEGSGATCGWIEF